MIRTRRKPAGRPAYALIYMLAALPLIAVVGNMAVVITGRALHAQNLAVAERADDSMRNLLLAQLRTDAQAAESAAGDTEAFGGTVSLTDGARIVEYQCAGSTVTRVERDGALEVSRSTWTLARGSCALRIERLANGRALVWLRCDVALPVLQRLPVTRQYTTAVVVGEGGRS